MLSPPRRLLLVLACLAALAGCVSDLRRDPAAQWSTRAALGLVRVYQRIGSPLMPSVGIQCRFTPTCSRYAEVVLTRHGLPRGAWLTVRRLARCGPWTPSGTRDAP
jgi:hypothetical protein